MSEDGPSPKGAPVRRKGDPPEAVPAPEQDDIRMMTPTEMESPPVESAPRTVGEASATRWQVFVDEIV